MSQKGPGAMRRGFMILPIEFETEMRHFPPSALKVFLAIRFRTVFEDRVALTTAALARITGLSEDSTRSALEWLADRSKRKEEARQLPEYIRREEEREHEFSQRRVQTIYVNNWVDPRRYINQLRKARENEEAGRMAASEV